MVRWGTATLFVLAAMAGWLWYLFAASLPTLDGVVRIDGLSAPVRVERDGLGIPTITAANRVDLARATGFVHGQDRFFQIDTLRRHPAGELSALFGEAALEEDKRIRLHRFRARARERLKAASPRERELLRAYAEGVEAGRRALWRQPWEYMLLRADPAPWSEEDSLLVVLAMYHMLQFSGVGHEQAQALAEDVLPQALAKFLSPEGSPWDAPMVGGALPGPAIPDAKEIDLRIDPARWAPGPLVLTPLPVRPGSNNWAVAGARTRHGGAIVANDMHLGLRVPHIWYRARFVWREGGEEHQVTGVTLPGTPAMVVGSNTHVAWGFTNTEGDFTDLVLLGESEDVTAHQETIEVSGGRPVTLKVEETRYGPVLDRDHKGRRRALRWLAHDPDAVNLNLMGMETARTLEEALAIAPACGSPAQNLVVADRRGGVAWTVIGKFPRRVGFDGSVPAEWNGERRWDGYLPPADYPRIVKPAEGILWTANNRVVGEPWQARLGRMNYDHGARAMQIRDGLRSRQALDEGDMLAIQLDDRALFLDRWQRLLLDVLTPGACRDDARLQALRREVVGWGARASVESVGFRAVRRWRAVVTQTVLSSLTAPCRKADPRFQAGRLSANTEESVWQLVTKRPAHLLPPGYASWETLLLGATGAVLTDVQGKSAGFEPALAAYTWGAANTSRVRHPLSPALGPLAGWLRLDMPAEPLPGDARGMPRIQMQAEGASQRMAVSPGREDEGYFHMPAGQSGHPLSPHYRDGHEAWARGQATPFLPGAARHTVELRPR
jgi:penicillin amidase